jgi:ribose-phosphate pyrophosphokinase
MSLCIETKQKTASKFMNHGNLKIFSGTSNIPLAEKICKYLNVPLGQAYHHCFPSNELFTQFKDNVRGADVFLIQGAGPNNANDNLMRLLIMADAAKRASADRITAVLPMSSYIRQDRRTSGRTPLTAKLMFNLIATSGIDRILTVDLHCEQAQGFTDLPMDHLYFDPILKNYIQNKFSNVSPDGVIVMAPDVGAVKRVERIANKLNYTFGFVSKRRKGDEEVELLSLVGDVDKKHVLIVDDMTESAGTIIQAARDCKNKGALTVTCAVTHGCFTKTGIERLNNVNKNGVLIEEFITSNTVDYDKHDLPSFVTTLDISPLLSNAIYKIYNDESVSALFE